MRLVISQQSRQRNTPGYSVVVGFRLRNVPRLAGRPSWNSEIFIKYEEIPSGGTVKSSTRIALIILLMGSLLVALAPNLAHAVPQQDNSDWSSLLGGDDDEADIKFEKREFKESNFYVLGIELAETMFSQANQRLGVGAIIQRGDASSGRTQACYVSSPNREQIHLIFEQGEVNFGFYLFAGGRAWNASDRCLVSGKISRNAVTGAGLRLGQTREQVIAILGKPTSESKNMLRYFSSVRKRASSEDLKQARHYHPELNDKDLFKEYGFYDLNAGITARFEDGNLTYLAVSKSETN
jgi:hypothetical protein